MAEVLQTDFTVAKPQSASALSHHIDSSSVGSQINVIFFRLILYRVLLVPMEILAGLVHLDSRYPITNYSNILCTKNNTFFHASVNILEQCVLNSFRWNYTKFFQYTPTSSYKYLFKYSFIVRTIKCVHYQRSWAGVRRSLGHQGEVIYWKFWGKMLWVGMWDFEINLSNFRVWPWPRKIHCIHYMIVCTDVWLSEHPWPLELCGQHT